MNDELLNLFSIAKEAANKAYSPYSKYNVGAVLVAKDGKLFTGCNIENQGIMSICAERVAFVKAISEGYKEFDKIVVVGRGKEENAFSIDTYPCGYCRQFMKEFCDNDFKIYVGDGNTIKEYTLNDLLPHSFEKKDELM